MRVAFVRACNGCKLKCEFTESRKSANRLRRCAIADTLAACARPAAQSHFRFSMVENRSRRSPRVHMCASISVSGIARRANRLRRCAIARQHARSLCAATGTVAPPFIDGRKSVASRAHINKYACIQASGRPKSRGAVTACPVAPSLSATLPQRAPARARTADPVTRGSKIGPVARPRQYACNDRGGRNRDVRQTARAVEPWLSATPPDRARHPAHSRRRFSMLENLFPRPPAPICVQASV